MLLESIATNGNSTATNQSSTATNHNSIATNGRSTATNDPPTATKNTPATANPNVFNECVDALGRKEYLRSPSSFWRRVGHSNQSLPTRFQPWQMTIQSWQTTIQSWQMVIQPGQMTLQSGQKSPNPNVFNECVELWV